MPYQYYPDIRLQKKYGSVILTNVIENSIRFNRIMQATENGLRSYYTQAVVITLVHMYT